MKKALVEGTLPLPPERDGWCTTVQNVKDILILNVYWEKELKARHCVNVNSGEYATLKGGIWKETQISDAYEEPPGYYYMTSSSALEKVWMSENCKKKIQKILKGEKHYYHYDRGEESAREYYRIQELERDYKQEKRERTEMNRIRRVDEWMEKVPAVPGDLKEWIGRVVTGGTDFCIRDQDTGKMGCSGCGAQFDRKELRLEDGGRKVKNNDLVICPACKKKICLKYRVKSIVIETCFVLMQEMGSENGVVRHFDARITHTAQGNMAEINEAVRIIIKKGMEKVRKQDIYYNQSVRRFSHYFWMGERFDNKGNPANRIMKKGYLYRKGIEKTLGGTGYQHWVPVFTLLADAKAVVDSNRLMCAENRKMVSLIEMLHKGRFWRLVSEISGQVLERSGEYIGILRMEGDGIEDIFGIRDRQKINRIRDHNGGIRMVAWMQWSERNHVRISDRVLEWLLGNKLNPEDLSRMKQRFSPEQIMNYIMRQKEESYPKWSVKMVINQYDDYLSMCEKLNKDTKDEMVYRPRELKRRHDEAMMEIKEREAEIKAEEYSLKFGEAERVLQEVKKKLEYRGEKYFIRVPERIVEIVKEGRELHHCAGSTDRYFDRIKQQETYICFLRKLESPDQPYYTIEIEPGGTIRQHRGMYDEEPEIEEIRPFLREWQKEIRRRMTDRDRNLEQESARKREENIRELREKNNIRVLQGLMEDFMGIAEEMAGEAN